jgi:hypothetical protein
MKLLFENWRQYLKEQEEKKKIFILVGPPSVGKSKWIENTFAGQPVYVINRDDIAESVASEYGWSYDDMFASPPTDSAPGEIDEKYGAVIESPSWMTWQPLSFDKVLEANNKVQSSFAARVQGAVPSNQDIIVDMTNMNASARSRALQAIEGSEGKYEKIAVDFEFEGAQDIIKIMAQKRAEAAARMGKNKTIPPAAFDRMFKSLSKPSAAEGFDSVITVDNREVLKRLVSEM